MRRTIMLEYRTEKWNPVFGCSDALSIVQIVLCGSGWTHGDLKQFQQKCMAVLLAGTARRPASLIGSEI
jgi:hypothetical protein